MEIGFTFFHAETSLCTMSFLTFYLLCSFSHLNLVFPAFLSRQHHSTASPSCLLSLLFSGRKTTVFNCSNLKVLLEQICFNKWPHDTLLLSRDFGVHIFGLFRVIVVLPAFHLSPHLQTTNRK